MSYSSVVLGDSPSSYWQLQETTGTSANDSAGTNTGTYHSGTTLGQQAPPMGGTSVLFNGTSGYMSTAQTIANDSTTFSIELWFNSTAKNVPLAMIANPGQGDAIVGLNSSGNLVGSVANSTESAWNDTTTTGVYNDGKWHYVCYTVASSSASIYVDGALSKTTTGITVDASAGRNNTWALAYNISGSHSYGQYASGYFAHFAVWDTTTLTATQVQNHYNAATGGTTPTGTISASGTSSTSISGYPVPTSQISANGAASVSVSGTAVIEGSISASGTGSVNVIGTNVIVGSITASGTSSASITGTAIAEGSITASGTSSVSITGSAVSGDSISAQGTSTVTVNGYSVPIGQVSAQGTSNVSVSGHSIVVGSISARGTSIASISGTAVSNASITASGSSSVSISGVPIVTASITAQGVSSVTIESSGAVFGSITAGGTSVVDIEGHTIIVGQINAQGKATVIVSTAKPIRAIINLVSSLDNKPSIASSLDNRINLMSGVTPLAAVNQNFNLWQYSSDQITFTHSGDLSGCSLEWIMQPNVLSATPTIKKTSADGSISITSTSASQSVYVVTITNADMENVSKGNYFHQATVVDGQQESNPICQGTVTVLGASNN